MDNEKLLQAISDMMDKKLNDSLQPINNRLNEIENRLDMIEVIQKRTTKKLDDL